MSPLARILIGFFITGIGVAMAWQTPFFLQILGRNWWAERNFGTGGTRLFYKLWGVFISVIGLMIVTDLFESIVGGFVLSLFGR